MKKKWKEVYTGEPLGLTSYMKFDHGKVIRFMFDGHVSMVWVPNPAVDQPRGRTESSPTHGD